MLKLYQMPAQILFLIFLVFLYFAWGEIKAGNRDWAIVFIICSMIFLFMFLISK
ncbi:MAG: hypothetical protein ACO2O4_00190 [Minisyncoccia bacterium]